MEKGVYTVSHYLLDRLHELSVDHVFGVPGDFVLGFFHVLEDHKVKSICTCNELNAAYAADGYARIRGLGAVATTYAVGELSGINGVAGSYAERVPVIAITGCPATHHFKQGTLLHHTLGDYNIPFEMFKKITIASTLIDRTAKAASEIDRVLKEAVYHQLPGYIGLPSDIALAPIQKPTEKLQLIQRPPSDPKTLMEAVEEAVKMIDAAKKPVIVVDGEVIRFHMQKLALGLIETSGLPFASMIIGKTAIDEHHPQFIGLYKGERSREYVRKRVEEADCIILLGPTLTDFNTGGFTASFDPGKTIAINVDRLGIRHHQYTRINSFEFLDHLTRRVRKRDPQTLDIHRAIDGCTHRASMAYKPQEGIRLTHQRFFDRISHFLDGDSIMMAETGSALFAGVEVLQPKGCRFMSQSFYGSIGYTVGATLGVSIAAPKKRVCLFVGDGSFQVTCQDISTMLRYHAHPIVFLLNNDGYLIERVILDGGFNDLQPWHYAKIPEVFSGGWGCKVRTEDELEKALAEAHKRPQELVFIEVILDRWDSPLALTLAGADMAKNNSLV